MSNPRFRPRSLFRARTRSAPRVVSLDICGNTLHVGREPLPSVRAWVEAHRSRFRAGTIASVIVEHDATCGYPRGGACTCANGQRIKVEGVEAENN
jgi:hypothetical protein